MMLGILVVLLSLICDVESGNAVDDVTAGVKLNVEGVVAAYGDFNADKATDVFIVSKKWSELHLYVWNAKDTEFKRYNSATLKVGVDEIVGVGLADFNGDGNMDVLLSTKKAEVPGHVFVEVYYGDTKTLKPGNFNKKMKDQPTIMDVNGDLYPDLFGVSENDVRSYWIYVPSILSFHVEPQHSDGQSPLSSVIIPNSNAFVDITSDYHPELLVRSKSNVKDEIMVEVWEQQYAKGDVNFTNTDTLLLDIPGVKMFGMLSFADINSDKKLDLVVPVCMTNDCSDSRFFYKQTVNNKFDAKKNWTVLISNKNHDWKFPVEHMKENTKMPLKIRFVELNMDDFPDATIVLERKTGGLKFAAYLINEPCSGQYESGCTGERSMSVEELKLNSHTSLQLPYSVSSLDVYENGNLDFLVTCQNKANKDLFYTKVLRNDINIDSAFLKVAVLSGLQSTAKYGAIQVGASVGIKRTNTDGQESEGIASQLGQSSYFALELPYVVFGLGKSPNFVDEITVGIPKGVKDVKRVKSWTAIIPNAQVIVIPHPPNEPFDWVTKLLVTPSKLLLQTGGVLIGICFLIAGIILVLHIKEKREDEREKRKEAHKFHFDAL